MTQVQTLLSLLRAVGTRGVHSHELRAKHFIGNPSQRISELEAAGYLISHTRERSPYGTETVGTRYVLDAEPSQRIHVAAGDPTGVQQVTQHVLDA
jgi:hypothetical protein